MKIFKNHLSKSITYRVDLFILLLDHLMSFSSVVILWFAIYKNTEAIHGFTFQDAVRYYIAALFVGFFTEVFLAEYMGESIKNGDVSNQFLKPYKYWLSELFFKLGTKFNYLLLTLPIFTVFVFVINSLWTEIYLFKDFEFINLFYSSIFIVFGWIMNFFVEFSLGLSAFWFNEVWSLKHLKWICVRIFSGQSFPIEFLPTFMGKIFLFLPFRFFYHTPALYLIGKRTVEAHLKSDLIGMFCWLVFFILLSWILWKFGVRKYEAYGR